MRDAFRVISSGSESGMTASRWRGCAVLYAFKDCSVPTAASRSGPAIFDREAFIIMTEESICCYRSSNAFVRRPARNSVKTTFAPSASACAPRRTRLDGLADFCEQPVTAISKSNAKRVRIGLEAFMSNAIAD